MPRPPIIVCTACWLALALHSAPAVAREPIAASASAAPAQGSAEWKAAYLISRAGDAYAHQRWDEAAQLFGAALKIDTRSRVALLHLADLARRRGDARAQEQFLFRAAREHPTDFAAQHTYGCFLLQAGRAAAATPHLEAAVSADAKSLEARVNLGDALAAQGKRGAALRAYSVAVALQPRSAWAQRQHGLNLYEMEQLSTALPHLTTAGEQLPNDGALWLVLGHAHTRLGNDAEALSSYRRVTEIDPKRSDAHVFLGNTLERLGRVKAAEAAYREAIRVNPQDPIPQIHIGNLHRDRGELALAQRRYERALALDPKSAWAITQLGFVHFERGEADTALRYLKRALGMARDENVEVTVGDLYQLKGKLTQAETHYRAVLERRPRHLGATIKLADTLRRSGKVKDALPLYQRAAQEHPRSAWALISLGDCERDLGQPQPALEHYRAALTHDPNSAWAKRQLGYLLVELGHHAEAFKLLNEVRPAFPREADLHLALGHLARYRGDHAKADEHYEVAMQLDPERAQPYLHRADLHRTQGEWEQAIAGFERAAELNPTWLDAWVLLGDTAALWAKALPPEEPRAITLRARAATAYSKALEIAPHAPWPLRQLAFLHYHDGEHDRAEAELQQVRSAFAEDVELPLALGHMARQSSRPQQALAYYRQAAALAKAEVIVEPEIEVDIIAGAITHAKASDAIDGHAMATIAFASPSASLSVPGTEPGYAIPHVDDGVSPATPSALSSDASSPSLPRERWDVRPWVFAGLVLRELGDSEQSLAELDRAVERAPDSGWAWYERSLTQFALQQEAEALASVQRAVQREPNARESWLFLGRLEHRFKRHAVAVTAYERALRITPRYAPAQVGLASALLDLGDDDSLRRGAQTILDALEQQEGDAFAELVAGHLFTRLTVREREGVRLLDIAAPGDAAPPLEYRRQANAHFERALQLAPEDRALRLSAAQGFVDLRDERQARAVLTPLTHLDASLCPRREWDLTWTLLQEGLGEQPPDLRTPEMVRTLSEMDLVAQTQRLAGDIALALEQGHQARAHYACSLAVNPHQVYPHLRLGHAYEDDGLVDLAEEHYLVAQQLEPDNLQARLGIERLRKSGGIEVIENLRLSGLASFQSVPLGAETAARVAQSAFVPGEANLAAVQRVLEVEGAAAYYDTGWGTLPRWELMYRFRQGWNTILNNGSDVEDTTGHVVQVAASGRYMRQDWTDTELRYHAAYDFFHNTADSLLELRNGAVGGLELHVVQVGTFGVDVGYHHSLFESFDSQDGDQHTEDVHQLSATRWFRRALRSIRSTLEVGQQTNVSFLLSADRIIWEDFVYGQIQTRLDNWLFEAQARLALTGVQDVSSPGGPLVFGSRVRAGGGYQWGRLGWVKGHFQVDSAPTDSRFDSFLVGVEGGSQIAWSEDMRMSNTGIDASGGYGVRFSYNQNLVEHMFVLRVGLSR